MWEFIISGNTYSWVQKNYNSLMGNRIGAGGFIINEVIYIFGGENTDDKLWRYDLQNNLWIDVVQFPIPTGLSGFYKGISFSYNNEGFAIKDNSNEIYKFNPNTGWCLAGSYTHLGKMARQFPIIINCFLDWVQMDQLTIIKI
ncbi:MAG: hypothetical protein IPL42_01290 [Saprospiraceae bacterium]|nr:hypothetical protein [Saprospiraceae bacterium]